MRFRRPDGSHAKLTLGPVDLSGESAGPPVSGAPLTLAGARALASEVHRQRALGRDVIADQGAARERRRGAADESASNTFSALAPRFIAERARPKTRRWHETARLLGLRYAKSGGEPEVITASLMHRWAGKPVREIDGNDIWRVVDETRRKGTPGLERRSEKATVSQARAMFAALSAFFGWLVRERLVDVNPCSGLHRPEAPKPRDRVLSNAEIAAFWKAADGAGEPFGQLLKLLLLTGCRLNEVAGMTRGELAEDGAIWSIPGKRTKNGRPHAVPLAPLARKILSSIKPIESAAGFIFTTTGRTPVSGWSKLKGRLDSAVKAAEPWRLHDVRRTTATGMAELGIAPHIVEAALNHITGAKAGVAGTYNRAAYTTEKRRALERWASHVGGLVEGRDAKVVSLRRKAS
jgi:integrase